MGGWGIKATSLHRWLNRRLALAVAALLFALAPALLPGLGALDLALFGVARFFVPDNGQTRAVTLVRLPDGDTLAEQQLDAMSGLVDALPALKARGIASGILFPASWQDAIFWTEQGLSMATRLDHLTLLSSPQTDATARSGLISLRLGEQRLRLPASLLIHGGMPISDDNVLPSDGAGAYQTLVWQRGEQVQPTLLTRLLSRAENTAPGWRPGEGVVLGQRLIPTDPATGVYAASPAVNVLDWSRFQANNLPPGTRAILFAGASDPGALSVAQALAALLKQQSAHTPGWAIGLHLALVLLVGVYLGFVTRLGPSVAALSTLLLAVVLLGALVGAFLARQLWLPVAPALAWLVLGHLLIRIGEALPAWSPRRASSNAHAPELEKLRLELARRQIDQGEPEAARHTLAPCPTNARVLEVLYDIGLGYERARKYDQARAVYQDIIKRQDGFLDVAERLPRLPGATTGGGFSATQTVVITDPMLTPPILGRYEIEKELGRGAMGTVYLATDPMIGRKVAVKAVDFSQLVDDERDAFRQRFFREAEAAGRLNHPHIVTVFDAGEDQNIAYLAMDYVPGETMGFYAKPEELLPVETVYRLIAQAAEALDYAHRQGVVHRDIKPGNMIYNVAEDRIKVTDFGIARVSDGTKTRTGTIMGSPSYMSPEQLAGDSVDGRSDIFSLGVSLYQLLTGQLPFQGETLAALAYQISKTRHTNIRQVRPDLPASAQRIVNKAMQKKPQDRYDNAREMAEQLQRSADRVSI